MLRQSCANHRPCIVVAGATRRRYLSEAPQREILSAPGRAPRGHSRNRRLRWFGSDRGATRTSVPIPPTPISRPLQSEAVIASALGSFGRFPIACRRPLRNRCSRYLTVGKISRKKTLGGPCASGAPMYVRTSIARPDVISTSLGSDRIRVLSSSWVANKPVAFVRSLEAACIHARRNAFAAD